jgi:hypothetical protein
MSFQRVAATMKNVLTHYTKTLTGDIQTDRKLKSCLKQSNVKMGSFLHVSHLWTSNSHLTLMEPAHISLNRLLVSMGLHNWNTSKAEAKSVAFMPSIVAWVTEDMHEADSVVAVDEVVEATQVAAGVHM